jgi:hypothetical protein
VPIIWRARLRKVGCYPVTNAKPTELGPGTPRAHRYSLAKKAAVFPRNSAFSRSSDRDSFLPCSGSPNFGDDYRGPPSTLDCHRVDRHTRDTTTRPDRARSGSPCRPPSPSRNGWSRGTLLWRPGSSVRCGRDGQRRTVVLRGRGRRRGLLTRSGERSRRESVFAVGRPVAVRRGHGRPPGVSGDEQDRPAVWPSRILSRAGPGSPPVAG